MLTFPAGTRLFLASQPTDLRRSFRGLSMLVQHHFGCDPTRGDLFIFLNRRKNQVRILFWDRDGFCIVAKKLERKLFRRIEDSSGQTHAEIEASELAELLCGVEPKQARRRRGANAARSAMNEQTSE